MLLRGLFFALLGTGFTCAATLLGSAMVYFLGREISAGKQRVFLGFAGGVMIAASVWSLLIPAMEMVESAGGNVLLPVGGGFLAGGIFLMALDRFMPHMNGKRGDRTAMVALAITLHNIPEGMAVGLAFAVAVENPVPGAMAGAAALALGMGLQNFPEGAAISLPLRAKGVSAHRAFLLGAGSGVVEPVFGLVAVVLAGIVAGLMPWVLSFSAGAMIYVTAAELIPEASREGSARSGPAGVMAGFLLMMLMDVLLG